MSKTLENRDNFLPSTYVLLANSIFEEGANV